MWSAIILVAVVLYLLQKFLLSKGQKPGWWEEHKIPEVDPSASITSLDLLFRRKTTIDKDDYTYAQMGSKKFCGVVESPTPIIFLKDLDLIKKILIKDFDHFVDRRHPFPILKNNSVFSKNLGVLEGQLWKNVRQSTSPTFTTGKIRRMMEHFNAVGQEWIEMLHTKAKESPTGVLKMGVVSYLNQYTIEVIAASVFGMKTGTIQNPNSMFAQKAALIGNMDSIWDIIKMTLSPIYPEFFEWMGIEIFNPEGMKFFTDILRQSLEARLKGKVKRNDFQQLLIEARKGELKALGSDDLDTFEKEAELSGPKIDKGKHLTDDVIIAQSMVFFIAGFTAVTNFVAFTMYALSLNKEVQEKLREEVSKLFKNGEDIDYDDLAQLTYLDMVTCEVLRNFPGMLRLERVCTKDYHDSESGLYIPKNSVVTIPVRAIHNDTKYYEYPEKFFPEHFSPEKKRSPYAFLSFGVGPRNCIGMRFALIESKAAIAKLVHNFRIEPTDKTPSPTHARILGVQPFPPIDLELSLIPLLK